MGRKTSISKILKAWSKTLVLVMASVIIVISGFNKITEAPAHQPQSPDPIHGVWLTHVGTAFYAGTGRLDNVFHQLSRLNFNRAYLSVYNDGVIYPSRVVHRNRETNIPLLNSLNNAIHEGKRQGLKVYAWFEYGLMLHANDPVAIAHPDWLLGGGEVIDGFVWLDPGHPGVEQYFVDLFTEFSYLYHKLDGIQLDDHWAVPSTFGNYVGTLTRLTEKVVSTIRQINPDWTISLSPNSPDFAYQKYSQDWLAWVARGYFDEVIVQIYRPTLQAFEATLVSSGLAEASQYVPVGAGIFTGFASKTSTLTPLAVATQQMQIALDRGYGFALFTYEYTFSFLRLAKTKTKESFFKPVAASAL